MKSNHLFALINLAVTLSVPAFAADTPTAPSSKSGAIANGNIYACMPQHYDPPCRLIGTRVGASDDEARMAELLAAIRASLNAADSGPILECGNGHGQSACCRVTAVIEDVIIIECGPR